MATDAELRDQAVAELKQTTVGYKNKHWTTPPAGSHWDNALDLLEQIGQAAPPPDPDPTPVPSGAKLRWMPPPTDTAGDKRWPKEKRTSSIGEIKGFRNVVAVGGEMVTSESNEGHIIPRENTGIFHWEGWRIVLNGAADAFTCRWRQPILQIQACLIEVTTAGTNHHSDGFQTQEAEINELRFDRCTIKTDYQGIFTSNEPSSRSGGRSKVSKTILSRILFMPGAQGQPATYYFKAFPPRPGTDPIGPCEFYDVWMPELNAPYKVYPSANFTAWDGSVQRYGCFLETKKHANGNLYPFIRFSKSTDIVPTGAAKGQECGDCQIGGDGGIWLGTPPANLNVGAPADVGMNYVSPGYA
jgi:hypothetical protein